MVMMEADFPPPPGGLRLAAPGAADPASVAAADRAARRWVSAHTGPLRPGTAEHTRAVVRMFRETFNPYKPTVIAWPELEDDARARLIGLPIWNIAVQTEGRARARMQAYADRLSDPLWRQAIALNGWEEGRHKMVLSRLVAAYGIALEPEPPYPPPKHTEWAYLVTGFSECIDSFFAFGLFALARRSGFFPPELVDTFEPVMQEECRHILLFANWLGWHRRTLPWWCRPWFAAKVAAVWLFLGWERVGLARGMNGGPNEEGGGGQGGGAKPQDNNFTVTGSKSVSDGDIGLGDLLTLCLEENDRRFAGYDGRLLRPAVMPTLARLALRLMGRRPPAPPW